MYVCQVFIYCFAHSPYVVCILMAKLSKPIDSGTSITREERVVHHFLCMVMFTQFDIGWPKTWSNIFQIHLKFVCKSQPSNLTATHIEYFAISIYWFNVESKSEVWLKAIVYMTFSNVPNRYMYYIILSANFSIS